MSVPLTVRPTLSLSSPRSGAFVVVCLMHVLLVVALQRLSAGPAAWQGFLDALRSADSIVFHLLAMAAAFYHAGTWFNATQKAMPLQIGEEFVKGSYISGAHYVVWVALSLVVLFLAGVF